MPKYYGGHDEMILQLASMSYKGCSILAVGRVVADDEGNSTFKSFKDVAVPEALQKLVSRTDLNVIHCVTTMLHV